MTTTPKTYDDISAIVKTKKESKNNKITQKELCQIVDLILTKFNLKVLYYRGYTPGFNDGDPCVHSFEVAISRDYFISNLSFTGDDIHSFTKLESTFYHNAPEQEPFDEETSKEFWDTLNYYLDDEIVSIFDTNNEITFHKIDGKVELFRDDYDCGF